MKRLVIYDLDGTLVDTKADIASSANHMRAELGFGPMPADAICRYVGHGLHTLVRACLQTDEPRLVERGATIYRAYYEAHLLDRSRLYPGALDVLEYFKARTQAVVSNKPNPYSRTILEGLGVARYFVQIIGGDDGYPKKPDPAAVLAVMRNTGATPGTTLLIGDSPVDVQTGRSIGALTVGIPHGFVEPQELAASRPDVLVKDFAQLLQLATQRDW